MQKNVLPVVLAATGISSKSLRKYLSYTIGMYEIKVLKNSIFFKILFARRTTTRVSPSVS